MGEISGDYYSWSEENTKKIAEKPGVYGLFNADRVLIYIGSSSNLRERFRHYWTTGFSEDPCKKDTRRYKREFREDFKARERALLKQYIKENRRPPKCNEKIP